MKDSIKMSQYFLEQYEHSSGNVKVELDQLISSYW